MAYDFEREMIECPEPDDFDLDSDFEPDDFDPDYDPDDDLSDEEKWG